MARQATVAEVDTVAASDELAIAKARAHDESQRAASGDEAGMLKSTAKRCLVKLEGPPPGTASDTGSAVDAAAVAERQPSGEEPAAQQGAVGGPRQDGSGLTPVAAPPGVAADCGSSGVATVVEVGQRAAADSPTSPMMAGLEAPAKVLPVFDGGAVSTTLALAAAAAAPAGKRRRKLGSNRAVRVSMDSMSGASSLWPPGAAHLRVRLRTCPAAGSSCQVFSGMYSGRVV